MNIIFITPVYNDWESVKILSKDLKQISDQKDSLVAKRNELEMIINKLKNDIEESESQKELLNNKKPGEFRKTLFSKDVYHKEN